MAEQRNRTKSNEQSELIFEETSSRPRWEDLSHQARQLVTELFARMLRQRRQGKAQSVGEVERE
jgi:hypothetical protein